MMRRRMAQMNARMNAGLQNGPASSGKGLPAPAASAPMAVANPLQNAAGKPGAQPNQGVLEAVKKVGKVLFSEEERRTDPQSQFSQE